MAEKKEKEKEKEKEEAEAPKPKGKKKLIFIVLGLIVLLAGAGVPMFLMKGAPKDGEQHEEPKEEERKIELADLGIFIVNLSEGSSFLKVTIKLEYDVGLLEKLEKGAEGGGGGHGGGGSGGETKEGGLPAALHKREPIIRDAVIRVLSAKHADEVLSADGKEKIKEELIEAINEASGLEEPVVTGVYFSEFMVQ